MVDIRQKGQSGERAVYNILNDEVDSVRRDMQLPSFAKEDRPFQRNQNQTAVGGSDLTNPFGLEIEVKNCKTLSLGAWWQQTESSASRTGGVPILVYKVQYKGWRVRMRANIGDEQVVADISIDDLKSYVGRKAYSYYLDRTLIN